MSGGEVSEGVAIHTSAAFVAAAARAVGEPAWGDAAERLAGGRAPAGHEPGAPRYRDLARAGVDLVEALADAGRWEDAAGQARHLTRYFTSARARLHAVAGEGFDGLHAAARARDREELDDFAALLRVLFP